MFARVGTFLAFALLGLALLAHQLGWVDGPLLLRASAALALVAGLLAVVRLPWDLAFQARGALARQEAAQRRGLVVDPVEIEFSRRSASRAMALAVVLHIAGAGLAAMASALLGPELGGILAVSFVAAMALRPVHAFYLHTRARLARAAGAAELPGPDAITLDAAVHALRLEHQAMREENVVARRALEQRLDVVEERTRDEASAWRGAITDTDQKLLKGLRDLERTLERGQEGAELLAGVRALLRLSREVKE